MDRLRQLIKEFYDEVENEEDNKNSKKNLAKPSRGFNNKMVGKGVRNEKGK